jgi:hypothetical protein
LGQRYETVKAVVLFRGSMRKAATVTELSCCSSVVEHFLGKEEVVSSILINSSSNFGLQISHFKLGSVFLKYEDPEFGII